MTLAVGRWAHYRSGRDTLIRRRLEGAALQHGMFAVLVVFCSLSGCTKLSPAGFWTAYRSDLIVEKYSDQGPWGGVRWVQWRAATPGTFSVADVMRFANSKGWVCREPVTYSAEQVRLWVYAGKPVFPLHFDAPDRPPTNYSVTDFPRNIDGDSWVTQCDSGWTRVEPGSADTKTAFGYIQVEKSGLRLAVYHLWSEI